MSLQQNMKHKIKDIKGLFALKRFSVLIIPDTTELNAKTHRFSYRKSIAFVAAYSITMAILGFLILNMTPAGNLFHRTGSNLSKGEISTLNELNSRMIKLNSELNEIRSSNEKLKHAIKLGDSTLFIKSSISGGNKIKAGGTILSIFRQLLIKLLTLQKENINFIRPSAGFISRNFDPEKGHMGIDFVSKTGTPVYVSANGFVIFADYTVKDGNMMIISHPGNYISIYKHCSVLLKKEREPVVQGELIALSGNTGEITTGPHLHFEIWKEGIPINPITVLLKL
jgi:murein DD-endopeptidase MepM/ murein hydrolase activator NlpD